MIPLVGFKRELDFQAEVVHRVAKEVMAEKKVKSNAGIKLGICGEHGGDPDSVKFCHKVGLTYVSCSPFRVPVARLAAAQAAIAEKNAAAAKKK